MKTYEEMAQSALVRGKAIRKQRSKAKRIILGALSGLAVCCLVILLSMVTGETNSDPSPNPGPLNYGSVNFLSADQKADTGISAQSFQYLAGTKNPSDVGPSQSPPDFRFQLDFIHVVAKAVEEYPDTYETLHEYGSTQTDSYRLFRMEVLNPLQSGIDGTFYYLLHDTLEGDLTQYDALLICMIQLPKNYALHCGGKLTTFEYLFADPYDNPELGNIIAFTNGIFDESLWQDESWIYGYQFGRHMLDERNEKLLVYRGYTLEQTLQRRQEQVDTWREFVGDMAHSATVWHYDFQTEEAQQVMNYIKPYENGIFVPERIVAHFRQDYSTRRYINGCPTSEWIRIDREDETVTTSNYRFEDSDFENLPDIPTYIASLDLPSIAPQHTDPSGKTLIFNSAVGWYEKTETGVYSIVRIAWRYFGDEDHLTEYYDETFILLDETGDHLISREGLIELIGDNRNISYREYGVGFPLPWT